MRTLYEIKAEIENTQREMSRLVIQASDIDERLGMYDRRLSFLHKELEKALAVTGL